MLSKLKTVLAFLVCAGVCGYAAYRELQWLAIAGLIGALCVLYRRQVSSAFSVALDLIKNTTDAKLGALEIRTEKRLADLAGQLDRPPTWATSVLRQLCSEEVGLLLSVSRQEKYAPNPATKKHLRGLRDRGLIEHDNPTLEDSDVVWVTALGRELAHLLAEPGPSLCPTTSNFLPTKTG